MHKLERHLTNGVYWSQDNYPHLHTPLSASAVLQWTIRDGLKVVSIQREQTYIGNEQSIFFLSTDHAAFHITLVSTCGKISKSEYHGILLSSRSHQKKFRENGLHPVQCNMASRMKIFPCNQLFRFQFHEIFAKRLVFFIVKFRLKISTYVPILNLIYISLR